MFLDRDGVINRAFLRQGAPHPPASLAELEILPGVPAALTALRARGYVLVVVTNQPDVARGVCPRSLVEAIHAQLGSVLPLDAIRSCFHDECDDCACRKPRPGLLLEAARDLELELSRSYMVGDRWRDMEAGRRAGCRTLLVDRGYLERPASAFDFRVSSLPEAAAIIIRQSESA